MSAHESGHESGQFSSQIFGQVASNIDAKSGAKNAAKNEAKTLIVPVEKKSEKLIESRLEELFIWKSSEELQLPVAQEQKFTDIIHGLGGRKRRASESMSLVTHQLEAAKSKLDAERGLRRYHEILKEYQAIQLAEYDQLKSLLGAEKLARYIVVKTELAEKLKSLLSTPKTGSGGVTSGAPGATSSLTEAGSTPLPSGSNSSLLQGRAGERTQKPLAGPSSGTSSAPSATPMPMPEYFEEK